MEFPRQWAVFLVRLVGLLIGALACWQLLGNVIDSYRDIDPSYLGYYFASQLARPFAGMLVGLVLVLFSRWIGGLLCKRLDK